MIGESTVFKQRKIKYAKRAKSGMKARFGRLQSPNIDLSANLPSQRSKSAGGPRRRVPPDYIQTTDLRKEMYTKTKGNKKKQRLQSQRGRSSVTGTSQLSPGGDAYFMHGSNFSRIVNLDVGRSKFIGSNDN